MTTHPFNRQHNLNGWIITSTNFGKTWKLDATNQDFFTGRVASAHFIQFGKDDADAPDGYVYADFPAADDGNSYWENGDYLLLGRVPKDRILERSAWEFYAGRQPSGQELWDSDPSQGRADLPISTYDRGGPHNLQSGLKALLPGKLRVPRRTFQSPAISSAPPETACPSQLTLFEATTTVRSMVTLL